jgi:hypothetical protein
MGQPGSSAVSQWDGAGAARQGAVGQEVRRVVSRGGHQEHLSASALALFCNVLANWFFYILNR